MAANPGLEVTHQATGVVGAVVEWTDAAVTLRDDSGRGKASVEVADLAPGEQALFDAL